MDKWESFFNWQTDIKWGGALFGPFEFLRPPREQEIPFWRYVSVLLVVWFLIMPVFVFLLDGRLLLGAAGLTSWAGVMGLITYSLLHHGWLILLGAVLLPFTYWPYIYFWNRRAARLRQATPTIEQNFPIEGVWPPPPKRG